MCPSAERWSAREARSTARRRQPAAVAVVGLLTSVGLLTGVGVLTGVGPLGRPTVAAAAPQPLAPQPVGQGGMDIRAPEYRITAPVLDIAETTSDLTGTARIDQLPKQMTVTFDATVLFGKDSAAIRSSAAARLAEVVSDLRKRGPGKVRIVGYTDDLGSAAHGLDLSRRRAGAVAAVLRRGLPAAAYPTTVVGKGEADPAVPNTSEANRRINRRVVLTYQPR